MMYTMKCVRALRISSPHNPKATFLQSRIVAAASSTTSLVAFLERLGRMLEAPPLPTDKLFPVLEHEVVDEARILQWFRGCPSTAVSLSWGKAEDDGVLDAIDLSKYEALRGDRAVGLPRWEVPITATTLEPLAHGSDEKAGNATIYRRMKIVAANGGLLYVPVYAGNAVRGRLRDILADHLLRSIGLTKPKSVATWFLHLIFSGGSLSGDDVVIKKATKAAGEKVHGFDLDLRRALRDELVPLSLLGFSLGNMIFHGRVEVGNLWPDGIDTDDGAARLPDLMAWTYLTRRDDSVQWGDQPDADDHRGMIASTEAIAPGVTLVGGIDVRNNASEVERSALALALGKLKEDGKLGARTAHGFGRVTVEWDESALPAAAIYEAHLAERGAGILNTLRAMGAITDAGD